MDAGTLQLLNHPISLIVAFEVSLLGLFSVPYHHQRNKAVLCVLFAIAVLSIYTAPLADGSNCARLWGFAWVIWLATFTKFLPTTVSPESKYWRLSHGFREAEDLRSLDPHKIAWSASLVHNLRGVGWNWQIDGVIPQVESRRLQFVLDKFAQTAALLLATDIFQHAMLRIYPTMTPEALSTITIRHPEWLHDCANKVVFGISAFVTIQLNYVALSTMAVACHWSNPQDWPPIFGDLRDSFSIRRFLGKSWHQLIRSSFATCSTAVIETLQIKRGSTLSSYLQVWMAFGISGLCHAHGILMFPNVSHASIYNRVAGTIMFFAWQAAAVCIEDLVQHLASGLLRTKRGQRERRLVGYAWVFWSFWMSLPWVADDLFRTGLIVQPDAMMSPPRSPGGYIVSLMADRQARGKMFARLVAYASYLPIRAQG